MDPITMLDKYGFPTALMCGAAFTIWKLGKWIGSHVAKPLIDSHAKFLDVLAQSHHEMAQCVEMQGEMLRKLADVLDEMSTNLKEIHAHVIDHGPGCPPPGPNDYRKKPPP